MKFRVKKIGNDFYIQRKLFLFWMTLGIADKETVAVINSKKAASIEFSEKEILSLISKII